jgi:hypothetical protein
VQGFAGAEHVDGPLIGVFASLAIKVLRLVFIEEATH